ncbi:MAG: penicillin-binding protein, partial [Firmicutes bacterium]|nr:penicillin-binding protein [Bacillota bacterium]
MRKLERRAILCLLLAFALMAGIVYYIYELTVEGSTWVASPVNQHLYTNGYISTGSIYDRNGDLLLKNKSDGGKKFNSDYEIRRATVHTVGDKTGNILTAANVAFAGKLVGYDMLNGTFTTGDTERKLFLTIDDEVCRAAYEALDGRSGTVGVYNYRTGEIICMVSSPNYDPTDPPKLSEDDTSGTYINKFISSTIVPGSTFKLVTSAAAIENTDYDDFHYDCDGSEQYGSAAVDTIRCTYAHGSVDFEEALAKSCNCSFGEISMELGAGKLEKYTKKAGLMTSYSINGIKTTPSTFDFPNGTINLAWTGIGQYHDSVNPCSMMVYMGGIANGGKAAVPRLIKKVETPNGLPEKKETSSMTEELIEPGT